MLNKKKVIKLKKYKKGEGKKMENAVVEKRGLNITRFMFKAHKATANYQQKRKFNVLLAPKGKSNYSNTFGFTDEELDDILSTNNFNYSKYRLKKKFSMKP